MDEYRRMVIEFVRNRPLLWNPSNMDYKNKEQRKQVWEDIDKILPHPKGITAKATWDHLARGFCNVLKRSEKKSGSGASSSSRKEWKFHQDMLFLVPVKKTRIAIAKLEMDPGMHSDEDSDRWFPDDSQTEDVKVFGKSDLEKEEAEETVSDVEMEREIRGQVEVAMNTHAAKQLKLVTKPVEREDDENEIMKPPLQGKEQANTESPRLGFFKSIMPKVDALTEDDFLDFQIGVLQILRSQRANPETFYYSQPQCKK